ncbi:MAG: DUF4325 domain-containing protein [Acidobacteria bacterium]|nr:DUF4325 domain-containing protein [Acidobacteriota bacterium]
MPRILTLPERFTFIADDYVNFEPVLQWFDWSIHNEEVEIDFRGCKWSNYQSLALLLQYVLRLSRQGCKLKFEEGDGLAWQMWTGMVARPLGVEIDAAGENFIATDRTSLFAVRDTQDRQAALRAVEEYTSGFPIDYHDYLADIVNEILYNTLEHGHAAVERVRIPSLIQFERGLLSDEVSVLIADTGAGVKKQLEQTYPAFERDTDALLHAIQPETSGTFGRQSEYSSRNNAGMGLYISSGLMMSLKEDMWIVSGNGQLHILPRERTAKELSAAWPGTFVLLTLRLKQHPPEIKHGDARNALLQEARERRAKDANGGSDQHVVSMFNYFGKYPEDKEAATKFRDRHLLPAIQEGKRILLDFRDVETPTHSFLNALLAGPVRAIADRGQNPFKFLRTTNDNAQIRETVLFILDTNT